MATIIKHIIGLTYKPLLAKYLSKTRMYRYEGLIVEVPPGVFHPGFFYSTGLMLTHLQSLALKGKKVLELGAGSGLISLFAAREGAAVTAIDISPDAVRTVSRNSRLNKCSVHVIHSDLFESIPNAFFDLIIINPPFYKSDPVSYADYGWYCGRNGDYFSRLFESLADHLNEAAQVIMVLSEHCDLEMISALALKNGFKLTLALEKKNFMERDFIFYIEPVYIHAA